MVSGMEGKRGLSGSLQTCRGDGNTRARARIKRTRDWTNRRANLFARQQLRRRVFSGTERISINPNFFKPLDAKLEVLSRAGILSAIVPYSQMDGGVSTPLPDDQIALLLRYIEARWGADNVAWLIALERETETNRETQWKKPGAAIFGTSHRAPVIVSAGPRQQTLDIFRDQSWVDVFQYQPLTDLTDEAFKS